MTGLGALTASVEQARAALLSLAGVSSSQPENVTRAAVGQLDVGRLVGTTHRASAIAAALAAMKIDGKAPVWRSVEAYQCRYGLKAAANDTEPRLAAATSQRHAPQSQPNAAPKLKASEREALVSALSVFGAPVVADGPKPSGVKAVYALGTDSTTQHNAANLADKPGHTRFVAGQLGTLGPEDKLSLVGHGDDHSFGGMDAVALAAHLKAQGVTKLDKLSLKGCDTVEVAVALMRALQQVGIQVHRVSARTGEVTIAANGRTLVTHADGEAQHQAPGSKIELRADQGEVVRNDVYAGHEVDPANNATLRSIANAGTLGLTDVLKGKANSMEELIALVLKLADSEKRLNPTIVKSLAHLVAKVGGRPPPRDLVPDSFSSANEYFLACLHPDHDFASRIQYSMLLYCLGAQRSSIPGASGLGDLNFVDSELVGRPKFSRMTIAYLGEITPGDHRRHIAAWHNIRFLGTWMSNKLSAAQLTALLKKANPAILKEARALVEHGFKDRLSQKQRDVMVLTYIMNSNPNNLWLGDGVVNSSINTASLVLRHALAEKADLGALAKTWADAGDSDEIVQHVKYLAGTMLLAYDPKSLEQAAEIFGMIRVGLETDVWAGRKELFEKHQPLIDTGGLLFEVTAGLRELNEQSMLQAAETMLSFPADYPKAK